MPLSNLVVAIEVRLKPQMEGPYSDSDPILDSCGYSMGLVYTLSNLHTFAPTVPSS